jgi:hypothetical protein
MSPVGGVRPTYRPPELLEDQRLPAFEQLRERQFVVYRRQWAVRPLEPAGITKQLCDAGYTARDEPDDRPLVDPDGVALIVSNAAYFPRLCAALRRAPPNDRPLVALWQSEPLPISRSSGLPRERLTARQLARLLVRRDGVNDVYTNARAIRNLDRAGLPDVLAVISGERAAHLAERGIASEIVPFGYEPGLGKDLGLERDIDVLMLGELCARRRRALRYLRARGVQIAPVGSWTDPALWGESRTRLMNRVRIDLNLSRTPGSFPGLRFLIALANGALPISEPLVDPTPFVGGEHFVEAPLEELPTMIRHYLDQDHERRAVVERGRAFMARELTLSRSLSRLLSLLAAASSARASRT